MTPPTSYPTSFSFSARHLCVAALLGLLASSAAARPVPQNLGNGLDKILENKLLQDGTIQPPADLTSKTSSGKLAAKSAALAVSKPADNYRANVAKLAATYDGLALKDTTTGKYLVDIMPNGQVPVALLGTNLQTNFPALQVTGVDNKYAGHGVIEGYIALDDAANIGKFAGVSTVILQLRPIHNVGAVTSQGINQHRVNRINTIYNASSPVNWDGTGMSIGVMSDSFNSQPSEEGGFTAAQGDVVTGDLPGTGNLVNSQPVVVLQDYNPTPGATNEGRAMCQVVADMAPKAQIAFATADLGEVQFANNIRALGGLSGYTYSGQTFAGDVVCDDVSYLDEPMFQDGIVAQGVIDVVNAGVTYCSSAANNWGTDGYDSDFRPVANGAGLTAATNSALAGTNIDLTGVDPSLYAGGFHNFNPNGLDVAQQFNASSDPQGAVFQWNDPYDTSAPTLNQPAIYTGTGDSTLGQGVTFGPFAFTQGQESVITEMATPQNQTENFDAIVDIINSAGKTIVSQDTGVDETVYFFTPATDNYTIYVHPYSTALPGGGSVPTMGHFSLTINTANGVARITQDFNLLFFDGTTGKFIEAVASNNFANNRPYELFVPDLSSHADANGQVQLVICRSNVTAPANAANHFKYVFFGNGASGMGPAEYNNYLTPVTFGHSAAAGANSVAAYSMFRPNLPEDFTSPGPVTIYFDTNNNRLATPQVRQKPDIAAADGANNTFFPLGPAQDVPFDMDSTYANFYGTSCASPHSAAVAALVLQAHGGHHRLTPAQVKTIMQLSTFPHDLDPYFVSGSATTHGGTVTVSVTSDNDSNKGTGSNNPNAWSVSYSGSGYVKEIHFNPNGVAADGGNPTGGDYIGGAAPGTPTEYSDFLNPSNYKFTPGMVFNVNQFTYGTQSDVGSSDATATFTNAAPAPSTSAFYWTLNVAFQPNKLTSGHAFRFDVGRNQQQDAQTPQGMTIPSVLYGQTGEYSADILGSGVLIPEYADNPVVQQGMAFSGIVTDGGTDYPFNGRLTNKIGHGYSPLDGYGFVNAQAATAAALPTPGVVSRKVHGAAGAFDIPLPLTGAHGIECRAPGSNNSYQLIFTFASTLQNAGNASVQGTGAANTPVLGPNPNQVTVNLTGVTNAQHLTVTLAGVLDTVGNSLSSVTAPMDVLTGDVNQTGVVDGNDVSAVQAGVRTAVGSSNFKLDVNTTGTIDGNDVSAVQGATRTSLP